MKQRKIQFEGDSEECSKLLPFALTRLPWLNKRRGTAMFRTHKFTFSDGSLILLKCTELFDDIYIKSGIRFDYLFSGLYDVNLGNTKNMSEAQGHGYAQYLAKGNSYKKISDKIYKLVERTMLPNLSTIAPNQNFLSFSPRRTWRTPDGERNIVSGILPHNSHLWIDHRAALVDNINALGGAILKTERCDRTGIPLPPEDFFYYSQTAVERDSHIIGIYSNDYIVVQDTESEWAWTYTLPLPGWVGTQHDMWINSQATSVLAQDVYGPNFRDFDAFIDWKFNPAGDRMIALAWRYKDYGDKDASPSNPEDYYYWCTVPHLLEIRLNPYLDSSGHVKLNPQLFDLGEKPYWGEVDFYYGYGVKTGSEFSRHDDLMVHTELVPEVFIDEAVENKYVIVRMEMYIEGVTEPLEGGNVFVKRFERNSAGDDWQDWVTEFVWNRAYFDLRYGLAVFQYRSSVNNDNPPDTAWKIGALYHIGHAYSGPFNDDDVDVPVKRMKIIDNIAGKDQWFKDNAVEWGTIRGTPDPGYAELEEKDASQFKLQASFINTIWYDSLLTTPIFLDTLKHEYRYGYCFNGYLEWLDRIDFNGKTKYTHAMLLGKHKIELPVADATLVHSPVMFGEFL